MAPLYQHYDLAEVLFYLKDGDYSFFDFIRDFSDNDAVVDMKENGTLYICNVSDSIIPDETVRRVIDVLEHWDEYLKQAYDWLRFWDFTNGELKPSKYKESLWELMVRTVICLLNFMRVQRKWRFSVMTRNRIQQ